MGTRTPQPCVLSHGVISRVHTTGSSVTTALCARLAPAPNRLLVSGAPQVPAAEDSRGSAFSPPAASVSPRAREPAARVSSSGPLAATHWGRRGERVSSSLSRVPRRGAKSPLGRAATRDWSGHTHTWTHAHAGAHSGPSGARAEGRQAWAPGSIDTSSEWTEGHCICVT